MQSVILHSPENDDENAWLAKITEIRMSQATSHTNPKVWVKVQWYYSAKDLENVPLKDLQVS